MNVYMSGTKVRSIAVFTNLAGVATDPTVTEFKYRIGTGVVQTPATVHDADGTYHYDIDTTGWTGPDNALVTCQWKGTGLVQAIGPDFFEVEPAAL